MKIYKVNASVINFDGKTCYKPEPILWCRQGMFCIIPVQVIQNALDSLDMFKKYPEKTTHPTICITWDQGIPVDPKVGYALLGE